MCISCHQGLSDEHVYNDFNEEDLKFGKWNPTSLSHLCIMASGFNGDKCRELGLKILDDYYKWNKDNKHLLITSGDGVTDMFENVRGAVMVGGVPLLALDKDNHRVVSLSKLRHNIDYIKNNTLEHKEEDEKKVREYMDNIQFGRDKLDTAKYLVKSITPMDVVVVAAAYFAGRYLMHLIW